MRKKTINGVPLQILQFIAFVKSKGHSKVSLILFRRSDGAFSYFSYPCIRCKKEMSEANNMVAFMPHEKEGRVYIYFLCDVCQRELFAMAQDQYEAAAKAIEEQLITLRAIAPILALKK